jgi:hypothetical protein
MLFDMLAADVSRPDLAATQKLFNFDLDSELFFSSFYEISGLQTLYFF